MIATAVALLFIVLASICNSIVDTVDHHQSISIFSKLKHQLWWNSNEGWRNKYIDRITENGRVKWIFGLNKPVQLTDSWHFFKMWMIIFLCTSVTIAILNSSSLIPIFNNGWDYVINFVGYLLIAGTLWNVTFTRFYHKIWMLPND